MRKVGKIVLLVFIGLLLVLGTAIVWLQTGSGQDWLTRRVVSYLRQKLQTRVEIAQVRFQLPDWIELQNIYLEDKQRDTLLMGKRVFVDLDVWGLMQNKVGINNIELENVYLNVRRTLPDTTFNFGFVTQAFSSPDTQPDTASTPLDMRLDAIKLKNVRVSYRDALIGTDAALWIEESNVNFSAFNPSYNRYHLTNTVLNAGKATVRMYAPLRPAKPEIDSLAAINSADSLDLKLGKIQVKNYEITYNDETQKLKASGKIGQLDLESDYIHLDKLAVSLKKVGVQNTNLAYRTESLNVDISQFNTQLENFVFTPARTAGKLKSASMVEKRGFVLRQVQTDFVYSNTQTSLENLFIQTNETILRNRAVLSYRSLDELTDNIGNVGVDVNLKNSQISFKDVLTWMPTLRKTPPFDRNPTAIVKVNGIVTGKVNKLTLKAVDVQTLQGTHLRMEGKIAGLPDPQKMALDLKIGELSTTHTDIERIAPKDALPASIEIPTKLLLTGTVKGSLNDLNLNTRLASDMGDATFEGNLKNFVKGKNEAYQGTLVLKDFNAGKLLKQSPEQLGKLSLTATVNGQGIDPKTLQAELKGTVLSADVKGYTYQNLNLEGTYRQQVADFVAAIADPNATLRLNVQADLQPEYPVISAEADIDELRLKPLNLYSENLGVRGKINAVFPSTNPVDPRGTLLIQDGVLIQDGKEIPLQTLSLNLENENGERLAVIDAPFLKARATGVFRYEQLADILLTEINRYFALPAIQYKPITEPYRFSLEGKMANHAALKAFVPELTRMDTVRFSMQLNSQQDTTLRLKLQAPLVEYDSMLVERVTINVDGANNKVNYATYVDKVTSGTTNIRRTYLNGEIANNIVGFNLVLKDSLDKDRHGMEGVLASIENNYRLQLRRRGLLLDYKNWTADSTGYVQFGKDGLLARKFTITQNRQRLFVNSLTDTPNGPLRIEMDSLNLRPLVGIMADSTLMGGVLAGNVILQNYTQENPAFTGDFSIRDLTVMDILIGNLNAKAANQSADNIVAEATLKSAQNDVQLSGNYLLKSKTPLNLTLDIRRMGMQTVEAFSLGELRRTRGSLAGKATIKGAIDKPQIDGSVAFDSVSFNVTQLGATYRINNSRLQFKGSDILLQKFVVSDTANRPLQIDGKINIAKIPDVSYDLNIVGKDFTVLNATRKENEFFYGKGIVDANLHVAGVGSKPAIDGSVKLKEGSDITVILPDDNFGENATEGIVEFINPNKPVVVDSSAIESTSVDFASEISLNLEADDRSQLTIVVDELNGDNLKVRGNAQLNAGISPSGQVFILGLYEITQGSYDLTFEILKRGFTIQKGSRLIWTGDPMKADVDITAVYPVTAELTALNQSAARYGKVPLQVLLKMQGSLEKPQITFDIQPDNTKLSASYVEEIKNTGVFGEIQQNQAAMNKQVFSLLVLNKFSGEQSSDFFSSVNPELIARESVSKLLTDQLNMLASDLIKGVKLDFNLNSTSVSTTTGTAAQTDLNVGLSKAFMDDRLTVNVGRNFEIEGGARAARSTEIIDNVNVNYNLTRDGRYAFRAYRKNQYQAVLEGFIVETGVSFAVVLDYDKLKEMFKK
ncbi:translocation/assembly module TamB domain-containing protein [Runella aurantiaca]|uniref:translocation/assembly module TamB domain-containing protein n=1 Tax=Runella aurantiaca TaxID=2282308 RepID=UPI0011C05DDE|nr:translocation/assembly module TamB domain-containing protein [Runella aurantiaca]